MICHFGWAILFSNEKAMHTPVSHVGNTLQAPSIRMFDDVSNAVRRRSSAALYWQIA